MNSLIRHLRLWIDNRSFLVDIIDINVIDPIIKVSNIQSQAVVIHQFHVVYLLIYVLVSTVSHLSWSFWATIRGSNGVICMVLRIGSRIVALNMIATLRSIYVFKIVHSLLILVLNIIIQISIGNFNCIFINLKLRIYFSINLI